MNNLSPQQKAWVTRRKKKPTQNQHIYTYQCVICKINPRRNDTALTCNQSCAGKLSWINRLR